MTWLGVVWVLCGSVPVLAQEAPEPVAEAASDLSVSALAGVWSLDAAASDAPDALLKALGRSSMERAMARRIKKVTQTVSVGDGWIEVKNSNALRTETTRTLLGTPSEVSLMGQAMTLVAKVEGNAVVSTGTLALDGGDAAFVASRSLGDADTMVLSFSLTPASGEAVKLRRVFRRQ